MAIVYFLIEEEDLYVVISRLWSVAIANKEKLLQQTRKQLGFWEGQTSQKYHSNNLIKISFLIHYRDRLQTSGLVTAKRGHWFYWRFVPSGHLCLYPPDQSGVHGERYCMYLMSRNQLQFDFIWERTGISFLPQIRCMKPSTIF